VEKIKYKLISGEYFDADAQIESEDGRVKIDNRIQTTTVTSDAGKITTLIYAGLMGVIKDKLYLRHSIFGQQEVNVRLSVGSIIVGSMIVTDGGTITYAYNGPLEGAHKVNIKYPDYCWNKNSGVIVDKNGNIKNILDFRIMN